MDFSKRLISDIRGLLWVVTVGGLLLAAYCIRSGFTGSLPWVSAMVGLPWAAHGTVCSFYLNMAKSDHSQGGITYEAAKAANFNVPSRSRKAPLTAQQSKAIAPAPAAPPGRASQKRSRVNRPGLR